MSIGNYFDTVPLVGGSWARSMVIGLVVRRPGFPLSGCPPPSLGQVDSGQGPIHREAGWGRCPNGSLSGHS
jgi:hypothetical protein